MSINKVILTGRITRDVELRVTSTGTEVVTFDLAVDDYQKIGGQTEKTASFISCVAYKENAKFLGNYVKKGYMLAVEGYLQKRSYDKRDGTKVYVTEVIVNKVENMTPKQNNEIKKEQIQDANNAYDLKFEDDDLPF